MCYDEPDMLLLLLIITDMSLCDIYLQGVPKKGWSSFKAQIEALNGLKLKKEENRPTLKFKFISWEVFGGQLLDCRNGLRACLIFDSVQLPCQHC